ncbi:MAG: hypothetical protein ABIJ56_02635 [Pseudomonadota bacterium]
MINMKTIMLGVGCAVLLVVAGCGGGGDEAEPPGGCEFPDSGMSGAVTVTPGSPVTFEEVEGEAQNTMDFEYDGQLAPAVIGALRYGPCGDAGLLLRVGDQLVFVDPASGGTPQVVDDNGDAYRSASLFFDADCEPLVIRSASSEGYMEYTRDGADSWDVTIVLDDISSIIGSDPSSLSQVASDVGADGRLYVFSQAGWGPDSRLIRGGRDAAAGSAWSFEELPMPQAEPDLIFGFWVDGSGATHTVYRETRYPCDPCETDSLHAVLTDGGSSWSATVVQPGLWGDPHDEFLRAASLAFDSAGNPFIAGHFARHVVTGSYKSAELRIYGWKQDAWCAEVVEDATDGYAGSDGSNYTGADPRLVIDGEGYFHVLWRDQSIWHAGGDENEIRGQLRYAVRSGSTWYKKTLLEQQGQTESANPLFGLTAPLLAVSPDGEEAVAAAVVFSWETDSIYNDMEAPVTYTARAVTATVDAI